MPIVGPGIRLLLTSATLLFVELLLIRWIPAEVRYIGFFSNFLLMASFLGIGVGILAGRRFTRPPFVLFALLLLAIVTLIAGSALNVQIRSRDELFFGLAESGAADANFVVLPLVFLLTTLAMAALALPLGPLLRAMPPLRAYAIDIGGSLLGIAAFTGLAAAGTGPTVWFPVAAGLVLALAASFGFTRAFAGTAVVMATTVVLVFTFETGDAWSPYYRVTEYVDNCGERVINVNGIPHQALHSVADSSCPKEAFYDQVYRWFPGRTFADVLVVGAGSGSDVALALARGAERIDAVEIDPLIAGIGDKHPDRPYDDPRVTVHTNDGRAFLRSSERRYDLVIFALPDSLTLVSTTANIRLESFLFTSEAFAAVREHLSPDGLFVLYNYYREPWLVAKLATMLEESFEQRPFVRLYGGVQAALAAGPAIGAVQGAPPGDALDAAPTVQDLEPKIATDDWPFLYLRTPSIASHYVVALMLVLLIAIGAVVAAARGSGTPVRRFSPHFFALGVAFLLLETRSLVSFSLLFGTTWLVNALVFFAILASVLLAIAVNARRPIREPRLLYAALFGALALAYLLPPESLLLDPPLLRYALAAILAFAPVFLANLVFTHSFRDTRTADMAFASNLLGAMFGGVMEYLALLSGYRTLLLVVAAWYALAYLFATRVRFGADRELSPSSFARRSA